MMITHIVAVALDELYMLQSSNTKGSQRKIYEKSQKLYLCSPFHTRGRLWDFKILKKKRFLIPYPSLRGFLIDTFQSN